MNHDDLDGVYGEVSVGFRIEQDLMGHTLADPPPYTQYISPDFAYWAPYQMLGGQSLTYYPSDKSYDPRTNHNHRHNHPPLQISIAQQWDDGKFWVDGVRNKVWSTGGYEPRGEFTQPPQYGDAKKALDYKHLFDKERFFAAYMESVSTFTFQPPLMSPLFIPVNFYSGLDVPGFLLPSRLFLDTTAVSGLVALSEEDNFLAEMLPMLSHNSWCNPGMQKFLQLFYVFYWDMVCSSKEPVSIETPFMYALICMKGVAKRMWGEQYQHWLIDYDPRKPYAQTTKLHEGNTSIVQGFIDWLDVYLLYATKHYHRSIAFEMSVQELPIHPNQIISMHRQEMVAALELNFPYLDNRYVQM